MKTEANRVPLQVAFNPQASVNRVSASAYSAPTPPRITTTKQASVPKDSVAVPRVPTMDSRTKAIVHAHKAISRANRATIHSASRARIVRAISRATISKKAAISLAHKAIAHAIKPMAMSSRVDTSPVNRAISLASRAMDSASRAIVHAIKPMATSIKVAISLASRAISLAKEDMDSAKEATVSARAATDSARVDTDSAKEATNRAKEATANAAALIVNSTTATTTRAQNIA